MLAQRAPRAPPICVQPQSPQLQTIADLLKFADKILVLAGAGISTAAGIPVREDSLSE